MTEAFSVATRKGLFRVRRDGGAWRIGRPAFVGEPVTAVLRDPRDGSLYAALRHGHFGPKLHRSADDGASWEEIALPALPAPEGQEADQEAAAAVDMIWTLAAGAAGEPGVLWAGTIPGALFRSGDHGASWALVEGLWNVPERAKWFGGGYDAPGIHTVLVDPRDPRRLTVGISCGGVWLSQNGGETWRMGGRGLRQDYVPPALAYDPTSQDVHRLAACRAEPDVIWCQHHNGIFLSRDGAATFTEIAEVQPSVFGFAVAAHPQDPQTAWFVPAVKDECRVPVDGRFVVNRTGDGGASFAALADGLPSEASYDLVYRHALDVDASGRLLVMGSTTGSLWTSESGGERWSLLSAHLPPIAQVAFDQPA